MKRVTYIVNRRPRATANVVAERKLDEAHTEYTLDNGKNIRVRANGTTRPEIVITAKTRTHFGLMDRISVIGNVVDIEEVA